MSNWIDAGSEVKPYRSRPILAYCPAWCESAYSIVTWNGSYFESETHGTDIDSFVDKWTSFLEAD
jgi:hypothetical protein